MRRRKRKRGKVCGCQLAKAGWIRATRRKMRVSCLSKMHKFRWRYDTQGRLWAKLKTRRERGLA